MSTFSLLMLLAVVAAPAPVADSAKGATVKDAAAPAATAPSATEKQSTREAIDRSLVFLKTEGVKWMDEKKCATCHHLPMMIWTHAEAKRAGFAIDDDALSRVVEFSLAEDNRAKVLPSLGEKHPEPGDFKLAAAYLVLAAQAARMDTPEQTAGVRRLVDHLVATQGPDGSWRVAGGRPPILDAPEPITLLVSLALARSAAGEPRPEPTSSPAPSPAATAAKSGQRAAKWLTDQPGPDNKESENRQSTPLRLLLLTERKPAAGEVATRDDEVAKLIGELLARQNADGGFSQTKDMPSDAFATGQALYAFRAAGCRDASAMARASDFLVRTQKPDGSWAMTSRPVVNAPSRDGPNNVGPIAYAATGWATLALLKSVTP